MTFDAAGQRTQMTAQQVLWNGNQITVNQSTGYDGDGLRVSEVASGVTTYYLRSSVLGGAIVEELNNSGEKNAGYVTLPGGQLLATQRLQSPDQIVTWKHNTPAGTSEYTLNTYNTAIGRTEFDPLGADVSLTAPPEPPPSQGEGDIGAGQIGGIMDARWSNFFDLSGGCSANGVMASCSGNQSPDAYMESQMREFFGDKWYDLPGNNNERERAERDYERRLAYTRGRNGIVPRTREGYLRGTDLNFQPQKSFSDCVNDWGLGGLGFTEEAANLIQDINDLEGTSRELLAVTWKNENSFRMRPGPNTKSGAANWMLWDVGPFHINIHWTMKALEKGEVSDRGLIGKNIFGYSFYRSDGKTPVSEFDGSPLEHGQMAARRLNAGGGSDEDKAAGYAPEYGRAHRRRDFRKYAQRFRDFYKCFKGR